ncbi:MAG: tRNA lysidine(34) synthetase TilS [Marinicella sp.]
MALSPNKSPLLNSDLIPKSSRYYVAFSGGGDSTALLHALTKLPDIKAKLIAIHVNHNIDSSAGQWANHCQSFCDQLNIQLIIESVELENFSENNCRLARQEVFAKYLKPDDCLLTAHHQADQVETILFRLMRGTGLKGITGMSQTNSLFYYTIHRPLFHCTKSEIMAYIQANQLNFVEDPSNQNNEYSRNFIRNRIIPVLQEYDTNASAGILQSISNFNLSNEVIENGFKNTNPINLKAIKDPLVYATSLYHWLHALKQMPPSHKQLLQFSDDCINSSNDKSPELKSTHFYLKRWQGEIYALCLRSSHPQSPIQIVLQNDHTKYQLSSEAGYLLFKAEKKVQLPITIMFKVTGARIVLPQQKSSKKVKHLFQEHNISPWERSLIPYVYFEEQLVAIGSKFISQQFLDLLSEYKASFKWISPAFLL